MTLRALLEIDVTPKETSIDAESQVVLAVSQYLRDGLTEMSTFLSSAAGVEDVRVSMKFKTEE